MSSERTRRDFLKLAAGSAALACVEGSAAPLNVAAQEKAPGDIALRITDATRKFAPSTNVRWRTAASAGTGSAILLDVSKTYQPILGFGAAFTDAACYMFNQLAPGARQELFTQLFHPSQAGLSVARICVGSSDYSTVAFSYDEGDPDPQLTRFSIAHDRAYILPMLRQARGVNPDLFLFASPWSPPGWMKDNSSMLGGTIRRRYLSAYANYFLKFLQAYQAEGVHINAISSQNEVDTDQDSRMPACTWPQEIEVEFVAKHLGPALGQNGVDTKIWLIDHNYNLWGRAIAELDEEAVHKYTNAIAWHGYLGAPEWIGRVHDAHPDTEMYWTEGGPDYTSPSYATDWCEWSTTFSGILRNWCRCIIGWNFALDEKGRPNIGPFNCGGLMTINSQTKAIGYSGQYWAMAHYSRSIRRGAKRFDSQGQSVNVPHAAFQNPDGSRVLMLTNPGRAQTVELRFGHWSADIALPPDAIVSASWA